MLDLENIKFRSCKISRAKDPNYIYVSARLFGNADANRTIDTYVYVEIWNADNPSVETIQLRVLEAMSNAFALTPEQRERAQVAAIPAQARKSSSRTGVSRRN